LNTFSVLDFVQTPTPIITNTSGANFEFNANNTQRDQTLTNYSTKNGKNKCDTSGAADTSSRKESWLITIFILTFATFVVSVINLYTQWKVSLPIYYKLRFVCTYFYYLLCKMLGYFVCYFETDLFRQIRPLLNFFFVVHCVHKAIIVKVLGR
jgi:magnesium-transporting ATPase (P-type)